MAYKSGTNENARHGHCPQGRKRFRPTLRGKCRQIKPKAVCINCTVHSHTAYVPKIERQTQIVRIGPPMSLYLRRKP